MRLRRDRIRMWIAFAAQAAGFFCFVGAWGLDHDLATPASYRLTAVSLVLISSGSGMTTAVLSTLFEHLELAEAADINYLDNPDDERNINA